MNNIQIDEEFKNLIPPLSDEEKEELEKSLIMFGCRDRLITWKNILIDGHNRLEMCERNNISYEILKMDYDFEDREEVKQWIIRNQFARRNIPKYVRSILALQLKESISKKAKENQLSSLKQNTVLQKSAERIESEKTIIEEPKEEVFESAAELQEDFPETVVINPIDTREEIAKIAGVSHDTIHKVETIEKEAPEVIKQAAKENVISINKAYNITKEVKALKEDEKEDKAKELLNQQYIEKAKQIDKEKKIADKIADAIFGILTVNIDEERIGYYLEYSPKESLDKHIARCNEAIEKLQEVKNIFQSMKKIKAVK